jgi:endonuclease/exonuclease/phosphatase family metal-dependent hydrolase
MTKVMPTKAVHKDFLYELQILGAPKSLCARLKKFLKDRHPGDQEKIYHNLSHTHEVASLTARMLHRWPNVPADRKVLIILTAALHDLDPHRTPGIPARVEATLEYLQSDDEARKLVADFCDRFHFTPGQVGAMVMSTDYSARAEEMEAKLEAFRKAHRYAFGDDPWVELWGKRLAFWDKIATYLHNTHDDSRRRVAGLCRELKKVGAKPKSGMTEVSRKFLTALTKEELFTYLPTADQKHFKDLLKRFVVLLMGLWVAIPAANANSNGGQDGDLPVAAIRVLVQNIYGRREKDCEARYKAIAKEVLSASPAYDIVAFQEHWRVPYDPYFTCDADALTKAMEADGRYKGKGKSIRHLPKGSGLEVSGGDSIFTLGTITTSFDNKFVNGRSVPLSGYALARVEVAPGIEVDFWNVHLEAGSDGCDDDCRWEQATDFGLDVQIFSGPSTEQKGVPVIIAGDFNTGGPLAKGDKPPFPGNGGYDKVLDALDKPRDLWTELGSGDAYTYDCQNNATQSCKSRERIDYVLLPEDDGILDPKSEHVLKPTALSVVRWKTDKGNPVSDHYGLDATFEVWKRPAKERSVLSKRFKALALSLDADALAQFGELRR